MIEDHPRTSRELKTIKTMIAVYCRGVHNTSGDMCSDCAELLAHAEGHLERCPFAEDKPTCAKCPIHCYQPKRREQIKTVMRYSGPRMLFSHPIFTVRHWLDGFRKVPTRPKRMDGHIQEPMVRSRERDHGITS
jgi:hypothetical protein